MVARLWGTANGTPVVFSHAEGDRWAVAVPKTADGTWILALWAEDMAGNIGYFATIKLLYSAEDLEGRVEILDVGAGYAPEDIRAVFSVSGPRSALEPRTCLPDGRPRSSGRRRNT